MAATKTPYMPQLPFANDDNLVEAPPPDPADATFTVSTLPGGTRAVGRSRMPIAHNRKMTSFSGFFRRSRPNRCRRTAISASWSSLGWKNPMVAPQISPRMSAIARKHRPIFRYWRVGFDLRQGPGYLKVHEKVNVRPNRTAELPGGGDVRWKRDNTHGLRSPGPVFTSARRKAPRTPASRSGSSIPGRGNGKSKDLVAEEIVSSEPFSAANSLMPSEYTGVKIT
jgi:hypothetical protein